MKKRNTGIFLGDHSKQFPTVFVSEGVRQAFAIDEGVEPMSYYEYVSAKGLSINDAECVGVIDQGDAGEGLIAQKTILENTVIAGYGGVCEFSTPQQSKTSDYRNNLFEGEIKAQIAVEIDQTGENTISDLIKKGDQNYLNYVWAKYTPREKSVTYVGSASLISHDISHLNLHFSDQSGWAEQLLNFCRLQGMPYVLLNINGQYTQGLADKVQHAVQANTQVVFIKTPVGLNLPLLVSSKLIKKGELILRNYGARYVKHFERRTGKKMRIF